MKSRLLKIVFGLVMAISVITCAFGAAACGKKDDSSGSSSPAGESDVTITFKKTTEQVEEYQTVTLFATVEGTDEKISWSSSDDSIATVSENGVVYGVKQGSAKITAAVKNAKAVCEVTVTKTYNAPVIGFTDYITIEEGESFEGEISVTFNGENVLSESAIEWSVADGADESVCEVSGGENGKVKFNAKKTGVIEFFVSVTARDVYVNKSITVKVTDRVINVVPDGSYVKAGVNGYEITLSTAEKDGLKTQTELTFTAYDGKTAVKNANVVWDTESEYYDPETAVIEGENGVYTVKKVSAGTTRLDGVYTSLNGKEIKVRINVKVEKALSVLSFRPTIEVEALKEIEVPAEIEESVRSVTLNGKNVFKSFSDGKITLNKDALPKTAKELGEAEMFISTDNNDYKCFADLYTLVINDKTELDSMRAISRACGNIDNTGVADGYFVLGNDIDYNGEFLSITDSDEIYSIKNKIAPGSSWYDGTYGFKGIFDGRGYNIDGLTVKSVSATRSGGFVGAMHNSGTFKNVSFTNAGLYENNGFICSFGGGLIENVSISFRSMGVGNENRDLNHATNSPRPMGAFFTFVASSGAKVKNCVVDALNANILYQYNRNRQVSNITLATKANDKENVIVLVNHEKSADIIKASGATASATSYGELIRNDDVAGVVSEFDGEYWTILNGIPLMRSVAQKIDVDEKVEFVDLPSTVYLGGKAEVKINAKYGEITVKGLYDGVTFENGVLSVAQTASSGEIVFEAISYINNSTVEKTVAIRESVKVTPVQSEIIVSKSDTQIDLSFASAYVGTTATAYYGTEKIGEGELAGGKLNLDFGAIPTGEAVITVYSEKDGTVYYFDVTVKCVTKIIRTAEDLKALAVTQSMATAGESITGYYVLGNDIDLGGAKIQDELKYSVHPFWNTDFGFMGTFDGQGHTISNFRVGKGGFFGQIGSGAVIRKVNFAGVIYSSDNLTSLFAYAMQKATVEYVKIDVAQCETMTESPYARGFLAGRLFRYNTIGSVTINAPGAEIESVFGWVVAGNTFGGVKIKLKSYNIFGYTTDVGEWKTEENQIKTLSGVSVTTGVEA